MSTINFYGFFVVDEPISINRASNTMGPYRLPLFRFIDFSYDESFSLGELNKIYLSWINTRFPELFEYINARPQTIEFKRNTIYPILCPTSHIVEIRSNSYWILNRLRKRFRRDLLFLSYAKPSVSNLYSSEKYPGRLFPVHIFGADEIALGAFFPSNLRVDVPPFSETQRTVDTMAKVCKSYAIFSYMDSMALFHTQEDYYNFQMLMKLSKGA